MVHLQITYRNADRVLRTKEEDICVVLTASGLTKDTLRAILVRF